jgi:recombination protein RecA
VEIAGQAGSAILTLAVDLVVDAQREEETTAWITTHDRSFFPPDAARAGLDLDALVVVRVPEALDVVRAADTLLRSGSLGLAILDLTSRPSWPAPAMARLAGLAREHDAAVVGLTEKPESAASLGSLVSLRGQASRGRVDGGRASCALKVTRDRRRRREWIHEETFHAPDGLC